MKMIRAIIRPESTNKITDALSDSDFTSMTIINVFGRGKQRGLQVGTMHYDELPKTMIMMVVEDESVEKVLNIITERAYTGNFGDGKIFITSVEKVLTVRTGSYGL